MYLLLFPVVYEVFHRLLAGIETRGSAT